MSSIQKITTPLGNIQLLNKINEIIDEINNYATTKPCVSNIVVSGTSIVVSFSDGSSVTQYTQDTTYPEANASYNGLMTASMVVKLNNLEGSVSSLAARVSALGV
jgi:hypothetical protein